MNTPMAWVSRSRCCSELRSKVADEPAAAFAPAVDPAAGFAPPPAGSDDFDPLDDRARPAGADSVEREDPAVAAGTRADLDPGAAGAVELATGGLFDFEPLREAAWSESPGVPAVGAEVPLCGLCRSAGADVVGESAARPESAAGSVGVAGAALPGGGAVACGGGPFAD